MPTSSRMPTALPLHSHTSWSPRPRSLSLQRSRQASRFGHEKHQTFEDRGSMPAARCGSSHGHGPLAVRCTSQAAGRVAMVAQGAREGRRRSGRPGKTQQHLPLIGSSTGDCCCQSGLNCGCGAAEPPQRRKQQAPPPPHLRGLKRTATRTLFFWVPSRPSYFIICVMAAPGPSLSTGGWQRQARRCWAACRGLLWVPPALQKCQSCLQAPQGRLGAGAGARQRGAGLCAPAVGSDALSVHWQGVAAALPAHLGQPSACGPNAAVNALAAARQLDRSPLLLAVHCIRASSRPLPAGLLRTASAARPSAGPSALVRPCSWWEAGQRTVQPSAEPPAARCCSRRRRRRRRPAPSKRGVDSALLAGSKAVVALRLAGAAR